MVVVVAQVREARLLRLLLFGREGAGGSVSGGGGGRGGGAASGVKRGKGRPKQDVEQEMAKIVQEFEECESTATTFFGSNYKARERHAKRLLGTVDQRMVSAECSVQEAQNLKKLSKAVSCCLKISKYIVSHGVASDGFPAAFDDQAHFLNLDPAGKVEFPRHLLKRRHEARIRSSSVAVFSRHLLRPS